MSPRELRRHAVELLRLAATMRRQARRNIEVSAELAARAQRQCAAADVAIDMARRQLAR